MFSSRIVRCSSPRPCTMKVSVSLGYSTRIATLLFVSRSRRSRIWRLVTYLPSRPASGEALKRKFIASLGLVHGLALQALEHEDLIDLGLDVVRQQQHLLRRLQPAAADAADADLA